MNEPKRVLGTFTLAMITVAAIVSLRNLPLNAEFGFSSLFYLIVAALIFLMPIALVTAELASAWPRPGANYVWVGEAFGKRWGFVALWVAWMESVAWFPAILAFMAAMFAHMLSPWIPGLEDNTVFIYIVMLGVFWGTTFLNFFGMETSGWVSSCGVILGTIIPGVFIICLGGWWILSGHPTEVVMSWKTLVPEWDLPSMVIFSGILLGLAGVELAAFHIREARNPGKDYPRALLIAVLFILLIYGLGTLAIAAVVPQHEISLASGLVQAFSVFFDKVGLPWMIPMMALFLFIGSLAGVNAWTVGPAKGMLVAAEDHFLADRLSYTNKKNVPIYLLLLQAVIGSVLSLVFLYIEDNNGAIWILIALSSQFTFIQYILVFLAAKKLRRTQPDVPRPYRAPLLTLFVWLGITICVSGFLIVFIPPAQLDTGDEATYKLTLTLSLILLCAPPFLMGRRR